ncbi:MAG: M1 family aminopeptidase, partial [Chitinophagaceae bacterium]
HDFAWFADKRFLVSQDTMLLPDKRIINLSSFYLPEEDSPWPQSIGLMKAAITVRSKWLVSYPYQSIKAVELALGNGGGMEYPTIATVSPVKSVDVLDQVLSHEIGHNWFYSLIGSNERTNAWMDEGINTYYDIRYDDSLLNGKVPSVKKPGIFTISGSLTELILQTLYKKKKDQPISTSSEKFSESNYYLISYTKAADFIKLLESTLGEGLFDSIMRAYVIKWSNKHPDPADFQELFESMSGKDLSGIFEKLDTKGSLFKPVVKRYIKPAFVINLNNGTHYNYISFAPLMGFNAYDGLMPGGIIHNYQLPPTSFQFFVLPLYGTRTKKLNGFGGVAYTWFPGTSVSQVRAGVSAARFTSGEFGNAQGKLFQRFQKIVPYLKINFTPSNPRSTVEKFILLKTYLIKEDELTFGEQIVGTDTFQRVNNVSKSRVLNQLSFSISDSRVLYPYSASLVLEQQTGFLRAGLTGKYYFNYANGVNGMDVRFFAGKFIYLGDQLRKNFYRDRYFLNMSGANGYEDYTYSNYFYGRNKFEGFSTQQMMIRDGAFKVRTDLLSNKTGKTDNWLMAANFSTGIPDKINPLSVLPFKIPISLFVDIGTYTDVWKKDADAERFLYDAGLQVSLFKQTVQVYVPLIYSKVFKDYFRSALGPNYFFKTISFSVNIQDFSLKKFFNTDAF